MGIGNRSYYNCCSVNEQVWLQLVGGLFIIGLNIVMTSIVLLFIKYVLRIPLRMSDEMLLVGDTAFSGEDAYTFGDQHPHGETRRHLVDVGGENNVIQGESPSSANSAEIGPVDGK